MIYVGVNLENKIIERSAIFLELTNHINNSYSIKISDAKTEESHFNLCFKYLLWIGMGRV